MLIVGMIDIRKPGPMATKAFEDITFVSGQLLSV